MIRRIGVAIAFLALLALIAKPVWRGRQEWHWGEYQDDSVYWVSAKSLASGHGYRVASLPGEPYAVKYPPVYPLFLSLAWRLQPSFPENLSIAADLQAILVAMNVVLLLALFRQLRLSWRRTLIVVALSIVTFHFVVLSVLLYSELLFNCLLLGSIITMERAVAHQNGPSRSWALSSGLLAGLAFLTRSAALPMFAAVPIFLFLRKRFSLSFYFAALAGPAVVGWALWTSTHASINPDPMNMTYAQEYGRVLAVKSVWSNLLEQVTNLSNALSETCFAGFGDVFKVLPLQPVVLIAALVGGYRWGRKQQWPLALIFTALYLVMMACWPSREGMMRFLVPVFPILLAAIAFEASHFASLCEHSLKGAFVHAPRWALIAAALLIMIHNDAISWSRILSGAERKPEANQLEAYSWIRNHAQKDDVVLAWRDAVSFCYSGVPASHSLFMSVLLEDQQAPEAGSLSTLPEVYRRGLVLLRPADLGAGNPDERFDQLRVRAESLPGASLEFRSPAALIYSFPIKP